MIVTKAENKKVPVKACLKIEEKQKMKGQANRIFLNLVQVDNRTDETSELYLADFSLDENKNILSWLMEPCRRRALQNTDTLEIDKKFMLDGYKDLFKRVVLI